VNVPGREFSAIRSRTINGASYVRKEDVVLYLRETAAGWVDRSSSEITHVCSDIVRQIADQIEKVK